ncbi:hypothetical protein QJQ45_029320, partial [Haematococcus lacustris]
ALPGLQITLRTSLIGLGAMAAQQLVLEPMREQQLSASLVLAMHAAFGGMFTIHSWVQGRVLQRSGALSLGVVNALRSSTVALASGLLFCSPSAPQQCLSVQTGSSAAVVSLGALIWATAKPPGGSCKPQPLTGVLPIASPQVPGSKPREARVIETSMKGMKRVRTRRTNETVFRQS